MHEHHGRMLYFFRQNAVGFLQCQVYRFLTGSAAFYKTELCLPQKRLEPAVCCQRLFCIRLTALRNGNKYQLERCCRKKCRQCL